MLDRVTIERLDAITAGGPVIVAFSGGGDSAALLHLMSESLGERRLRAVIVDHALRPGSRDDAEAARSAAAPLADAAEVVTLAWPGGLKRSQQAAREERYRALSAAARRHDARAIALAHTLDDQAETVLMRAASGSAWRGLAGMASVAPAPIWPEGRGLWVVRPLLNARRAALRTVLKERGASWLEDPANANRAFERVRVRARLAELERSGLDPVRIAELARALRRRVERVDADAAALIARAARFDDGRIILSAEHWVGVGEVRRRALSALLAAVSGGAREPGWRDVDKLEARMATPQFRGAALAGAIVSRRKQGFLITRDRGAIEGRAGGAGPLPRLELPLGEAAVWDGRLELCARAPGLCVAGGDAGPILEQRGRRLTDSEAAEAVERRWLLLDHVGHLLAQHINDGKRGQRTGF
jgi:tRNA(Ile)-lysidine synthase